MRKAFTLIELLIVIAIIAVLSIVVILALNPAALLQQSRDSSRLSDLSTLNSAVNTYATDQAGASSFSLGSSSVTYLSIPDPTATTTAGTNCSGLGGNFATGTTFFHCPASSTYKKTDGTGWIPINFTQMSTGAPLGNLPVDPANSTSSNLYYSYQTNGTTYRIVAMPESQKYLALAGTTPPMFTAGSNPTLDGGNWVPVPGNPTFGTNNFYVMKYDAACASISTGVAQTTPTDGNGYKDNSALATNCTAVNGLAPAALPNAIPIVDVSQTSSASYCASIGAHLITNNEWQTIAWNAESQGSNWNGGVVGTSYLYSGHNDGVPAQASVASPSDSQNCVGTDGPVSCGGTGATSTQIRTLTLSNGSVIWDMAGNIWQWTNDTITGTNQPHGTATGWNWYQFNDAGMTYNGMTQSTVAASTPSWNSAQGVGELFSENQADATTFGFRRGGGWGIGGLDGVESLGLTFTPGTTGTNISLRCAR